MTQAAMTSARLLGLVVATWALAVAGCPTPPGDEPDAGDAGIDAGDAAPPEAGIDARPDSQTCVPTPGTDATPGVVHQLPPTGENEVVSVVNYDRWVAYSETRNQWNDPYNYEIYLYDLESSQEFQLTNDTLNIQRDPYIWGLEVMWTDRGGSGNSQLNLYDIATSESTVLISAWGYNNASPKFNDDHILYWSFEGVPDPETDGSSLYLLDRHTSGKTLLCPYSANPETAWMGERFPAWVAHPEVGGNGTKDVFYYDVDARQVVHLETTVPGHQFWPMQGGDFIYWQDDRDGDWNIYRYNLLTGVEDRFTWNDQDQSFPLIRGHLLTWTDYRWSCGSYWGGASPADLILYDVDTDVMRQVTAGYDLWTNKFAQGRWMVYTKLVGYRRRQIFAHDLVADGLLDGPDGHVIPGPGAPLQP